MATFGTPVKNENFGASYNTTVDCGSGSDRCLFVGLWKRATGGAVDTITYNSVSMTAVTNAVAVSGSDTVQWYQLVAPTTGSNTLAIALAGGGGYCGVICVPTSGVDQTTPASNGVGTTDSGGAVTVNVTSAVGKTVMDVCLVRHSGGGGALTKHASQTLLESYSGNADAGAKSAGASYEAGDTSVTMSWTASVADSFRIAALSVNDVAVVTGTARLASDGRLVGGILLNGLIG